MDIEIIHYKMPTANQRLCLDGSLDMVEKITLVSCATMGNRSNLPTGDIQVHNERLCAVPDVLKFLILYSARSHRQRGMLTFQGLDTTQFIRAHHPFAFLDQLWCLVVHPIDIFNLLVELFIFNIRQPITDQVRLEVAFFLKASPRVWARFRRLCLVS